MGCLFTAMSAPTGRASSSTNRPFCDTVFLAVQFSDNPSARRKAICLGSGVSLSEEWYRSIARRTSVRHFGPPGCWHAPGCTLPAPFLGRGTMCARMVYPQECSILRHLSFLCTRGLTTHRLCLTW